MEMKHNARSRNVSFVGSAPCISLKRLGSRSYSTNNSGSLMRESVEAVLSSALAAASLTLSFPIWTRARVNCLTTLEILWAWAARRLTERCSGLSAVSVMPRIQSAFLGVSTYPRQVESRLI